MVLEKERGLGLMPAKLVPARVDAATKQGLGDLVDYAAGQGWAVSKTCQGSWDCSSGATGAEDTVREAERTWTMVGPEPRSTR